MAFVSPEVSLRGGGNAKPFAESGCSDVSKFWGLISPSQPSGKPISHLFSTK
jgi:hypothetical protein